MTENLFNLGIFLGGLSIFFIGCGFFWYCSIYAKKGENPNHSYPD